MGLKLYEWGNRSLEQFDIRNAALPVLEKLRQQTDLTCHLGILDEVAPIYLMKLENTQPIGIRTGLVKITDAQLRCGESALCWLPQDKIDELLPEEVLPRYTETTITSKSINEGICQNPRARLGL